MNMPPREPQDRPARDDQRDRLLDSERRAQPENYKPEAVDEKIVEFEPGGPEGVAPIQGLDPDEPRSDRASRDRPA